MSKRRFTVEQMADLQRNSNVAKCSDKAITYRAEFKVKAVKRYQDEGISAKQIFQEAGFDQRVIGTGKPKDCLGEWMKVFKTRGVDGLSVENRGKGVGNGKGRPKTKGLTDAKKIEWLEAKVAYLKAENDFLAKLRAKRAE